MEGHQTDSAGEAANTFTATKSYCCSKFGSQAAEPTTVVDGIEEAVPAITAAAASEEGRTNLTALAVNAAIDSS